MNDFFNDETPAEQEAAAILEQETRDKIQAEVFDGTPANFSDSVDVVDPNKDPEPEPEPEPDLSDPDPDPDPKPDPESAKVITPLSPEMQAIVNSVNKLTSGLTGIQERLRKTESKIGNITHEFETAKEAAATQAKAPTQEEMAIAAKDTEAWEDLKKDFPSWASAINSKLSAQANKFVSVDDFNTLRKSISDIPTANSNELETRLVGLIHPDWQKITKDPNYATWLNAQSTELQDKAYKGTTAEEAIDVFNQFKSSQAEVKATPEAELSDVDQIKNQRAKRLAASTTASTNHKTIKQKSKDDMTELELRESIAKEVFAK